MTTKHPFQQKVSSKYGAPMGRHSDDPNALNGNCWLREVPFVDGDYDQGGAYWGGGRGTLSLFCAWMYDANGDMLVSYTRAYDRERAKAQFPNARFYR